MFAQQGRLKKAVFNCGKAIELQPNSARAYMYRLVHTVHNIRTYSMFICMYICIVCVQVGPTLCRGCYRMVMSQNADALEDFNRAAKLCPASSVVFFNRALCQQTLGNLKQVSTTQSQCHTNCMQLLCTYSTYSMYTLHCICTFECMCSMYLCAVYYTGYWRLHRVTGETG